MDEKFKRVFRKIMKVEGGYSDDKDDRGGETKFGITKATARRYGYQGDMKDLSKEMAIQIYYDGYWSNHCYDKIKDDDIATEMFDQAINMGPGVANSNLQKAYNLLAEKEITVDGIIGQQTLMAINGCKHPKSLYKLLNIFQGMRYIRIAQADESQKKFVRGWIKRVEV
jgi:lysozyme family protein